MYMYLMYGRLYGNGARTKKVWINALLGNRQPNIMGLLQFLLANTAKTPELHVGSQVKIVMEFVFGMDEGIEMTFDKSITEIFWIHEMILDIITRTYSRHKRKCTRYITGDCGAAEDVYSTHHYTDTPAQGAAASLKVTFM